MTDPKTVPVDTWKGVRIDKMPRKDLEAEFVKLATQWAQSMQPRLDGKTAEPAKPKPPIDPHTARAIGLFREIIGWLEAGKVALRRVADVTAEEDGLHRDISLRVTFIPPTERNP